MDLKTWKLIMLVLFTPVCKHVVGTPARRVRKKNEGDQRSAIQLAADYTYIAGRHWRLLTLLMLHTQMMGIVVMTGDRENDIKSVASVLNEIGVGGLNIKVATDNERY